MATVGERISELIKYLGLSKTKFADGINISQPFVSELCSGAKLPSERTISDICRVYGVSHDWLTDGTGDMFVKQSLNEEILEIMNDIMGDDDESFRKRFMVALGRIPTDRWQEIADFLDKLAQM